MMTLLAIYIGFNGDKFALASAACLFMIGIMGSVVMYRPKSELPSD